MRKLRKIDGACAPLALKYLSRLSDAKVLQICEQHGFKHDWGMEEFEFLKAARELGIRLRRMNMKKSGLYQAKLRKFIKIKPEGVFLLYTDRHLFVVDNGGIFDPLNGKSLGLDRVVTSAWYAGDAV